MDIIEDYKQTLGISYLDAELNKKKMQKAKIKPKTIRPTLSIRDSILKYLDRPLISSLRANLDTNKDLSLVERI